MSHRSQMSRRRSLVAAIRNSAQSNTIEFLERRTLMSVASSTFIGTVTTGEVKTYETFQNGVSTGTSFS
jgi:hypothetical protein